MEMTNEFVASVVISGLVIVFIALIILIVFVALFGKIFDSINAKQKKAVKIKTEEPVSIPAKTSAPAPVPEIEDGIGDEVIAVIAAAVAAMGAQTGKKFALRSVKHSMSSRGAWGNAGVNESMRNF